MGKFTDDFFTFPIKVYDGFSAKKAMEEEDKDSAEGPVPIDWVKGWATVPARDMHRLMWHDGFSRERNVKDVAEEGFDLTIIVSDLHGEFVCTWPRKKFEEKINEFMGKWEESQSKVPFITFTSTANTVSPQGEGGKFIPKD